jgi:molybdopterin synthase catalytic subunit
MAGMACVVDVALVRRCVEADDAPAGAAAHGCGGEGVFIGRTRGERREGMGALTALRYDAYEPMARGMVERICAEAGARHACGFIGVRHALGDVPVGRASVLVRALAGHRDGAFAACREVIDRLKSEAPIWKLEVWEQGATWREDAALAAGEGAER